MGDYDKYMEHFTVGMKVNVGIPVPGGKVFHDWAIIRYIDEDLVELQLSRDILPAGVRLSVGNILEVRAGKQDAGYSSRAIIVSEGQMRSVMLRLIGEIVSDELREFYRIDTFLPIKYFIVDQSSETQIKKNWITKRDARIAEEKEIEQNEKKPWERLMYPQPEQPMEEEPAEDTLLEDSGEGLENGELENIHDHEWDDVLPLAANISGGGISITLHHMFDMDTLVPLEIFLPTEPKSRVIDAIGKVVFVNRNYAASKQTHIESFNTGIQFVYIDERDRDAIVSYISNVQLKRIRLLREKYLGRALNLEPPPPTEAELLRFRINRIIISIISIFIIISIIFYFKGYVENRPKNEIEIIFEKGFVEYLKKIGKAP